MDFLSRDRQRRAVEALAPASGEAAAPRHAPRVGSARQAAASHGITDRSAHVGYHLVGPGRRGLETISPTTHVSRSVSRGHCSRATLVYLSAIGAITAGLLVGVAAYTRSVGGSRWTLITALALLLIPASDLAVALRPAAGRVDGRRGGCCASTSPTTCRTSSARWSSCRRCSPARRPSMRCSSISRCSRSQTSIPPFISRSSATIAMRARRNCRKTPPSSRAPAKASWR